MLGRTILSALALGAAGVLAAPSSLLHTRAIKERCSAPEPPASLVEFDRKVMNARRGEGFGFKSANETLQVNTFFHYVSLSDASNNTNVDAQLSAQLAKMNNDYAGMDISFNLVDTTKTVNSNWAIGEDDFGMKSALRQGSYADLNMYFLSNLNPQLLGFCYFPTDATTGSDTFTLDGCVVQSESMPGGLITDYNLGATATHEIGHYLGLFHVFQGSSCSGEGDMVADTPEQSTPTNGCPATKDSCPNAPGLDSIQNFMDYSFDSCMDAFTTGQKELAFANYNRFRAGK